LGSLKVTKGTLLRNPKDEVFEKYAKCPVSGPLSLCRGPFGEPGGGSFAGAFERKEKYIWVPFLDPEVIKILSLSEALVSLRLIYISGFLFFGPRGY
jgi:hypothetical protein